MIHLLTWLLSLATDNRQEHRFSSALHFPTRRSSCLHSAHEALIMMCVWILAMSAVLPTLVLPRREAAGLVWRSEEHTSELQSRRDLVCRLLLEKKKLCKSD